MGRASGYIGPTLLVKQMEKKKWLDPKKKKNREREEEGRKGKEKGEHRCQIPVCSESNQSSTTLRSASFAFCMCSVC